MTEHVKFIDKTCVNSIRLICKMHKVIMLFSYPHYGFYAPNAYQRIEVLHRRMTSEYLRISLKIHTVQAKSLVAHAPIALKLNFRILIINIF